MATVLDYIKHYQQVLEKYPNDEPKILRCIDKLYHLDVTVQHLQETGVGRTVNALRKEPGDVGQAARALVYKWKLMVAAEESDQEADHRNETSSYNGHVSEQDSEDNVPRCKSKYDQREKSMSSKSSRDDKAHKHMNGDHGGSKRKNKSSEDEEPETKKSRHSSSSDDRYKRKHIKHIPKESESDSQDSEDSNSEDSDSGTAQSSEEDRKSQHKIKEDKKERDRSSSTKHSSHKSHKNHKSDSASENSHKSSDKHSKHHSESKKTEKYPTSEKSNNSYTQSSSKDVESSMNKKHKSSHKSKDNELSSSKHSNSNRESSSSTDKQKHNTEKHRDTSEKHNNSNERIEKDRRKTSSEKESSSSKHKSKESKHSSSSSKERPKEKSTNVKDTDHSHKCEKRPTAESSLKSSSKEKHDKEKKNHNKHEDKNKKNSTSTSKTSKSSSSKTRDEAPKKKTNRSNSEDSTDGIDCGSGASFAEALGMISPVKAKKKSIKDIQSPNSFLEPSSASLLAPTAKLTPLPALEISALPEISPNYKPRPPPKLLPHFTDEDAMNHVISSKNQRTKVYSGNKVYGKIPTLYEMCVQILQEHIDALEFTGGVPYEILKPVVDKATPQQLFMLEHYNPYLMEDTDHLWQKFCEKHFRNKQRQEMETWREMYMRCQEEQEHRLKSLTANIKIAQEAKKAPIKQTKMAYVDTIVKPPRNIARKQALHGTAHASTASPAARVASLATAPNVLKGGSVRPPPAAPVSVSTFNKPKRAPLMQKALQFMRGRKR